MNIVGASNRFRLPFPATDASRLDPMLVYRRNPTPCTISIDPSPYIFIQAFMGDESGTHEVPEPSRDIGSPTLTVERISIDTSPVEWFMPAILTDISPGFDGELPVEA
jgi:hypothetical protein